MSAGTEHIAGCEFCTEAIRRGARPFDSDLCHMDIRPDADQDWDNLKPPIQCPHLATPGGRVLICADHLEGAIAAYVRMVERTQGLN